VQTDGIYKVFSVVIAVALAIYVNGERNPYQTRQIVVPLGVQNQERGVLIDAIPQNVTLDVSGPKNSLARVSGGGFRAAVNLKGKRAGTHMLRVVVVPARDANIPPEVDWTVREQTVSVALAAEETRSRALIPVFLRPAPAGYSYDTPVVAPAVAALTGPREAIALVTSLEVVVDAAARPERPIDGQFDIKAVDSEGNPVEGVRANPPRARVRAAIRRLAGQKEVLVSPSISGSAAPGYRITSLDVVPKSVVLAGNPETLAKLNMISTRNIDVSDATTGMVRSVQILVPDGVTIQGSSRARVEITVKPIAPAAERD